MTPPNQTSRDRVLIVEDDPAVGQLLARILSYKDYDACVATDGPSGVDAFQSAGDDHFKLAIIDYSMPGLVGDEVAKRIRAMADDVCIILTSGFGECDKFHGDGQTIDAFLQKPFSRQAIMDAIALATANRSSVSA